MNCYYSRDNMITRPVTYSNDRNVQVFTMSVALLSVKIIEWCFV
jgi:hypothetical protein